MAELTTYTTITPPSGYKCIQKAIHHAVYYDSGTYYMHFKTNIPNASYIMGMIEAIGYTYGGGTPIRCSWVFYTYSSLVAVGVSTTYGSAVTADSVYISADGYLCIRAYGPVYFAGFILNSYTGNPTGAGHQTAIIASKINTDGSNY